MEREEECDREIREKIFIIEIGNLRKIGSIGNVSNSKFENVRNFYGNNRGRHMDKPARIYDGNKYYYYYYYYYKIQS